MTTEISKLRRLGDDSTATWRQHHGQVDVTALFLPADFRKNLGEDRMVLKSNHPMIVNSHLIVGTVEKLQLEVVIMPILTPDHAGRWILAGAHYSD
jgi:hypothetical protein